MRATARRGADSPAGAHVQVEPRSRGPTCTRQGGFARRSYTVYSPVQNLKPSVGSTSSMKKVRVEVLMFLLSPA